MITPRQREILLLSSTGLTKSQVGRQMYLSEDTVKTHLQRLYRFYGVDSLVGAVAEGLRRADLDLDPVTRKVVAGAGLRVLIPAQAPRTGATAHVTMRS